MNLVFKSLGQAVTSLFKMHMFLLLFGPPVLTSIVLLVLYSIFWTTWTAHIAKFVSYVWGYSWIVDVTGFASFGSILAWIFLIMMFFPLAYVISVAITSVLALPVVVRFVSHEYPTLLKKRGGSNWGSVLNTLAAGGVFLFWLIVTLPLWLIPGAQIIIPLFLSARFNKRVFMYDVLQDYASAEERKLILDQESFNLTVMGMLLGLIAYVPFAFIFLPTISALAFTYHGFNLLQDRRSIVNFEYRGLKGQNFQDFRS